MRQGRWAVALLAGFVAATPVWAQRVTVPGNRPGLIFQPVDTSRSIAPPPVPFQPRRTSFIDLFRKIPLPTFPPLRGQSNLPPPSAFPTYPNFKAAPFVPANEVPRYIPPGFPRQ